ncbi:MAG: HEAT repeat domain-containing protein [Proteobacteria bacterium]|nr:HEAT repeat domain-containing protein [Pseudomonadota bacterium]
MTPTISLWEEPLYRLVLQIMIIQVVFLIFVIIGIILTRSFRLFQQKRNKAISAELYTPLMNYLASDMTLEAVHDLINRYPRGNICRELERYAIMLGGDALSKIRALYERLDLRNFGIRLCHSFIWWRRLEGVRLLGVAGGHDIVDVLLDRLKDSHAIVRLGAARSLGRTKNPRAIEPILKIMAESKRMSRRQLAQTLVAFGPASHPALRRIIRREVSESYDEHFIAMALEMLALTGDIESVEDIKAVLDSTHLEVRIAAFKACVILHIPLSASVLEKGLADSEWPVRAQAALAAGKTGDTSVVYSLGACLSDGNWWVRHNAGFALHKLGTKGIDELERVRDESHDRFARDMATRTLTNDPTYKTVVRSRLPSHFLERPTKTDGLDIP